MEPESSRLIAALAAGQIGTWRWDRSSRTLKCDATMEALLALAPGEFGGSAVESIALLHPDDAKAVEEAFAAAIKGRSSYAVGHRVIRPDGSVHAFAARGEVTLDGDGNVTGMVGYIMDDTAFRLAEARADRAEEHALREERERQRLQFLHRLNDAALTSTHYRDLMRQVATAAVPQLGDWCAVHFLPRPDLEPVVEIAHHDPRTAVWARKLQESHIYDPAALSGVPAVLRSGITEFLDGQDVVVVEKVLQGSADINGADPTPTPDGPNISSVITAPLRARHGIVGAIQMVWAGSGRHYGTQDVELVEAAAGRLAEALHHAWLADQREGIAAQFQQELLPRQLPTLDGLTVASHYHAGGQGMQVGGDFYDIFPMEGKRWGVVIGDVCGTGASAAVVTAAARYTVRAAATHGCSPTVTLQWLNDALIQSGQTRFCTLFFATLEPLDDGPWKLVSAVGGHPLPVLHRATQQVVTEVGVPGTLLGVLPSLEITESETVLERGDTLVLYTDGVTDLPPPFDLDLEDLHVMVSSCARDTQDASEFLSELVHSIDELLPLDRRHDDIALVAIRVH